MVAWKPKRTRSVTYLVERDREIDQWHVSRNGVPTGVTAADKSMAIGEAYQVANREAASSEHKIRIYSLQARKRTKEWGSP